MTFKNSTWHGTLTALVTPMTAAGNIDLAALRGLVEWQIAEGISGLVACGTTGESATLTLEEWQQVVTCVVKTAQGRVPVMAGAGTQSTRTTTEMVQRAQDCGAQGALVVTPFYNKPTQSGLRAHFEAVANGCALPIMLYNVPSRTACDLSQDTVVALSAHPHIIGIKDATGDLKRLDMGLLHAPKDFVWLSGDDPTACAFTLMGGHGVISVASNFVPKVMSSLIAAAQQGQASQAAASHRALVPLFSALGLETNPLPIKTALALTQRVTESFRLPLCPMQPANRSALHEVIQMFATSAAHGG